MMAACWCFLFFFFQAEDGIRDLTVTGVQTCALPISIMRLVGATDGFIRRPFLLQGAIKGMLGGVAAIGLSYGAYVLINRWLLQVAFFSREQALAIVGFGMLIGLFGSAASVGRHLRRV